MKITRGDSSNAPEFQKNLHRVDDSFEALKSNFQASEGRVPDSHSAVIEWALKQLRRDLDDAANGAGASDLEADESLGVLESKQGQTSSDYGVDRIRSRENKGDQKRFAEGMDALRAIYRERNPDAPPPTDQVLFTWVNKQIL